MSWNDIKKSIHKAYVAYYLNCPVNRGKYRLARTVHFLFGEALYEFDGLKLMLSPVCGIGLRLISGSGHDPHVAAAIKDALKDGGNFIDVGAHFGYMSLLAAKAVGSRGKVFAFEPSKREYTRLLRHIKLNGVSNIAAFNMGLSDKEESGFLNVSFLGNTGANSRREIKLAQSRIPAKFAAAGDVIPEKEMADVRCVKIDTEGDEVAVLKGFEKSMAHLARASFIVEITGIMLQAAGHTPQDIYDFFARHSFKPVIAHSPKDLVQYDEIFKR